MADTKFSYFCCDIKVDGAGTKFSGCCRVDEVDGMSAYARTYVDAPRRKKKRRGEGGLTAAGIARVKDRIRGVLMGMLTLLNIMTVELRSVWVVMQVMILWMVKH